ncbi:MAG: GntR family transcriptional regulator [Bradyrhizobiaceae bacterium]|nr:MAG: GntR family transcriptional regulator [Bradyrhizobiaceae bacterium]
MKAVVKRSAEHLTTRALRNEIVSGKLGPMSRLREIELSEKLQVSRATIRAALHQLTAEGLIVQVPYTGWTVMTLTARDAWELYTLRASLEGLAAKLAAAELTDEDRLQLEAAFARLAKAAKARAPQDVAEADFAFHNAIISAAKHRRLSQQYRFVEQQVRLSIISSNALLSDIRSIIPQHEPILEAILSGKPSKAASVAEAHNQSEGMKLVEHLEEIARESRKKESQKPPKPVKKSTASTKRGQ